MKKIYISILLTIVCTYSLFAVFEDNEPSCRARAMGGAFTAVCDDANAIFYNPAGLSFVKAEVGGSYTQLFSNSFQEFSTAYGAVAINSHLAIGTGVQMMDVVYKDETLESERTYTIGNSLLLVNDVHTKLMVGAAADIYHLQFQDMGSQTSFGVNAGFLAVLHERTRIGFQVTNINNPTFGENDEFDIPQKISAGISYVPYEGVITAFDVKKPVSGDSEYHAGTEIAIHPLLKLRAGIRNNPGSYSLGAGFLVKGIQIDYAYNSHSVLDGTNHISVSYHF